MPQILLAAYGTLRLNQGNYRHFINNAEHLGTFKTEPKYTMIHLGGFPGIVEDGETPITYDLFKITDEQWKSVCYLEGYHGSKKNSMYYPEQIETPHGEANIFIYNTPQRFTRSLIESGDWLDK